MNTPNRVLAAAVALTLSGAGVAYALGEDANSGSATPQAAPQTESAQAKEQGPMAVTETLTGVATPDQAEEMESKGFAAARAIGLARLAVNDDQVEAAKKILGEARVLLGKVEQLNSPVTVTKDVKMGDKEVHREEATVTPDMIPIYSETRIVETFEPDSAKAKAVEEARGHLSKGDRKKALEVLKLAEVELVTREVSMPIGETVAAVDQALAFIDQGKLHEANLELKKATDGLVEQSDVVVKPAVASAKPADTASTSQAN
jgi:hypothetical protein